MNLRTVNHLVASVWLIYGFHYESRFAISVGLLWTTAYVGEVLFAMIYFDERTDDILRSAARSRTVRRDRRADMTGSDYEPYNKR